MTENIEEFPQVRKRRFDWVTFLPKRKAWIKTLCLLPFGLPIGNFLAANWRFAINSIFEERQYLIGVCSMAVSLLLPSLFFGCLFHWCWFAWKQASPTWYPTAQSLWAGTYATLTIACSFGLVGLFTKTMGVCGNPAWGAVGETLFCNLDGYGFESKSWFGVWFIIAAYCYQAQSSIAFYCHRIFDRQNRALQADHHDFTSNSIDAIANPGED
jgi:hypothetical protein